MTKITAKEMMQDNREKKWDQRFLALAQHIAQWSKDPSTKVGAVIVRPDLTVASLGFNGFPRTMIDVDDRYKNRSQKLARVIHAEQNAILFAREPVVGYTLYTWPLSPCHRCATNIIQAGIKRVVAPLPPASIKDDLKASVEEAAQYFAECGVDLFTPNWSNQDGNYRPGNRGASDVSADSCRPDQDLQPSGEATERQESSDQVRFKG